MKILIYFLLVLFIVGCNDKSTKQIPLDTIKVFNNDTAHYEDIFKGTEIIFLETNSNCLISKISQLYFFSNKIFVLDQNTKNIFVFNNEGHFLNKIGTKGNGPGEYIRPLNFIISKRDSLLKVYDSAGKKILSYNFNGEFIGEIYINKYLSSFGEWNNGLSGYWGYLAGDLNEEIREKQKESIKFIRFDSTGREIQAYEGDKVVDNLYLKDCYITSENNNRIYFVEPYSDKIFSFNGEKVIPIHHIDFSGNFIPPNYLKKITKLNSKESSSANEVNELINRYVFFFLRFFENDNWIYCYTPFKGTSIIHNKITKKEITFHNQPFKKNGYETFFWPLLLSENRIYSAPNPSELFDLLKDSGRQKYSEERILSLRKLLKNVNENDNPIIFIYDIKE